MDRCPGSRYPGPMRNIAITIALALTLSAPAEADQRTKRPGKAARQGFVEQFAEMQKSGDLPFILKLGTPDTTLSVVVTRGSCTKPLLEKIVEISGDPIRNVGFTLVECSSDRSITVRP